MSERRKFSVKAASRGDKVVFREDRKAQFPMAFKFAGPAGTGLVVVRKLFEDEGGPQEAIIKASKLDFLEAANV